MTSHANLRTAEGNVNGTETITLSMRVKRIIITNDSSSAELKFKFNSSEDFATLKPTETISMDVTVRTVILQGTNVNYRIWGVG